MGIKPRHTLTHPVSWMDLFWATKGWLAMIAGVALLIFTLVSVNKYRLAHEFATTGVWTTAEITKMRTRRSDDDTDYLVTFAYQAGTRQLSRERDTGGSYYRRHDVGDQVDVKYLPQRPTKFEYKDGQTHSSAQVFQIIAGIAGVLGCGVLWWSGSKANKAVLARRYGVRSVATIERFVEHKNSGKPTGRGYMIFRTKDGLRGESLNGNIRELRALGSGTEIVVFVRGRDVWWEGDVGPREARTTPIPDVERS